MVIFTLLRLTLVILSPSRLRPAPSGYQTAAGLQYMFLAGADSNTYRSPTSQRLQYLPEQQNKPGLPGKETRLLTTTSMAQHVTLKISVALEYALDKSIITNCIPLINWIPKRSFFHSSVYNSSLAHFSAEPE